MGSSGVAVERLANKDVAGGYTSYDAALRLEQSLYIRRRLQQGIFGDIFYQQGRPVVCLSSDDGPGVDYSVLWPIIRQNNLPWTCNVCIGPNAGGGPSVGIATGGNLTWAQIKEMRDYGVEFACHSRTHVDPTTAGGVANFVDETVNAAADLRATVGNSTALAPDGQPIQLNVDAFVQPGTWTGSYNFDAASKIDPPSVLGSHLRSQFALVTAYVADNTATNDSIGALPAPRVYGVYRGSGGLYWETGTTAQIQQVVRRAIGKNGLVSLYGHIAHIDQATYRTSAELTTTLQWLAAQRDAGNIELMTLTAAHFARPSVYGRINLLGDGDFHLETVAGAYDGNGGWILGGGTPTVTLNAAPGATNSMKVSTSSDDFHVELPAQSLRNLRIEFDARRGTAGTAAVARLIVRGLAGASIVQDVQYQTGSSSGPNWGALTDNWQHFVCQFCIDPRATSLRFWPYLSGTGPVEYGNLKVYKQ